jgi:hypothetical protein
MRQHIRVVAASLSALSITSNSSFASQSKPEDGATALEVSSLLVPASPQANGLYKEVNKVALDALVRKRPEYTWVIQGFVDRHTAPPLTSVPSYKDLSEVAAAARGLRHVAENGTYPPLEKGIFSDVDPFELTKQAVEVGMEFLPGSGLPPLLGRAMGLSVDSTLERMRDDMQIPHALHSRAELASQGQKVLDDFSTVLADPLASAQLNYLVERATLAALNDPKAAEELEALTGINISTNPAELRQSFSRTPELVQYRELAHYLIDHIDRGVSVDPSVITELSVQALSPEADAHRSLALRYSKPTGPPHRFLSLTK